MDVHHRYYYRRDYASGLSKVFRELEENKVLICRAEHEEIHATTPPPEHPSREEMLQAIGRNLTRELEALNEQEVG
jgi:hypothetical protein